MLTVQEKVLLSGLDENRMVALCQRLVRIPTVNPYSGDKAPSGEWAGLLAIEEVFKAMGATLSRIPCDDEVFTRYQILAPCGRQVEKRHNVVAEFMFGDGQGPTFLLDAHIDTVAVDTYDGDPFSGELREGCLHGRGTSDDKGGIAVMIEAVKMLLACPEGLRGKLVCCVVTDEECDGAGRGSLSCIAHLPKPDAAMVIDGDCDCLQNGCNGFVTARVTVPGRSGHSAYGGLNAIEQAFKLLPALERFRTLRGDQPGIFNFGVFQAGDHPANVPASALLAFNIKTSLDDMRAAQERDGVDSGVLVRELFERCLAEAVAEEETLRKSPPTVTWVKDVPAASSMAVNPDFIAFAQSAYLDATGTVPTVKPLGGWGDLAHFLRVGIPTVGIGTGTPGMSHAASERVTVADMVKTAKAAALITARFLSA
jgi:acetylornithine deacetylase/succinyl-diaminopimelate desuccinylase-like protein